MTFGRGTPRRALLHASRFVRPRTLIGALSLALLVPAGLTPMTEAHASGLGRPDLPEQRVTEVHEVTGVGADQARALVAKSKAANHKQAKRGAAERKSAWPDAGDADLVLTNGKKQVTPGGLPMTVRRSKPSKKLSAPSSKAGNEAVHIEVLGQKQADKAGVTGVLFKAGSASDGQAHLTIDYGGFAGAVGGGWAQRLRLATLPSCVLTTPKKPRCREQTPLQSHNDISQQTVSADVNLSAGAEPSPGAKKQDTATPTARVFALAATSASGGSPSGAGSYSATPLAPASSWKAGNSSGSFTWSHDFPTPPAAAGPGPALKLSYDSGVIDGRTATTNNQGTLVGEGFRLTQSYITRAYGSCDDDGHDAITDWCWKYDNASLVLNGHATKLVKDDDTGDWHLAGDDASKVTHSTGADNADDNGEYWTIVTGDGTKYVFGKNKLPGAGDERTDSVWTAPVFGDDSGEPGYSSGASFSGRSKKQAWRWNLDYVEDTHGNAMTYWYKKESNHYKSNKDDAANADYVRGGYLTEIRYGQRADALFTDDADAKVTFSYKERCTASDCSDLNKDTAKNWPDVPFDAICSDGDTDCIATGPSFFTRKRLTGIDTFSWSADSSAYQSVDSWTLKQKYLDGGDIGDSSDQVLVLESLQHTGKPGDDVTLNPIKFTYQLRPNRVDATDDILPLTRPRIDTITSRTGSITTVTLSDPECRRSEVIDAPEDTNTRNCYPQYWHINGAVESSVDWFNKYRVLAVSTSDPTGMSPAVEHAYTYSGAAWHYNDNPLLDKDERTWSQWRGYRKVTAYTGAKDMTRSKTVSLYLQGMDGDKEADGGTRNVTAEPIAVQGLDLPDIADSEAFAGQLREQIVYDGSDPISVVVKTPWSQETSRQNVPDAGDQIARYVRVKKTTKYTHLTADDSWRARSSTTTYDDYGMPIAVSDSGEIGKGGDQTCTRTWYARNDAQGITNLVSRKRTVGQSCSVAESALDLPQNSDTRGDVLSDTATVYDDADATTWTPDQQPTRGEVTWTGRATGYPADVTGGERRPTGWQTTATQSYDTLGRQTSATDAAGNTSTTTYRPADSGPLTRKVQTNPAGQKTYTYIDPLRGQPLRVYDPNINKTEYAYDALGRLTSVWLPNRIRGSESPNIKYVYHLGDEEPSWVSTAKLKADGKTYNTSYALYDSLLRPLQTQTPTPLGGRVLTDTRYDSRGLAYETHADIFDDTSEPNSTYTMAKGGEAPVQKEIVFDGAGRPTKNTLYVMGVERWSTTTSYTGDSVATTALEGGSATRTITDVRGRTVETRRYTGQSPADADFGTGPGAPYTSTRSTYALDDQLTGLAGPDGAHWSYGYDLFGRQVTSDDPDKGTTTTVYNKLGKPVEVTDARGKTIVTAYDELGRVTGTWHGSKSDANQLTAYTYDTVFKGKPATSTRYVGGKSGRAYTRAVTKYDSLSRPVETKLTLPQDDPFVQAGADASYVFSSHYREDGTLGQNSMPAMGGLEFEISGYDYNSLGQLTGIGGGTGYLLDVSYNALGQRMGLTLGVGSGAGFKRVYVANTYENGTRRLLSSSVTDMTHGYMLQDLQYGYDDAGNVTSIADPTNLGGTSKADTQCFAYDGLRRLTQAWTPGGGDCTAGRSVGVLGGPAPYWTSYAYNDAGLRTSVTHHASGGDTERTYCYGADRPHALTGTSLIGTCAVQDRTYGYDPTGNTVSRPGPVGQQELIWSPAGKLKQVVQNDDATNFIYDADGQLLIRSTEGGERILYAGSTELHLRQDGTMWARRYYGSGSLTVAVRSNESGKGKLSYLVSDPHGSSTLAVDAGDEQTYSKRYLGPFGTERTAGAVGNWVDDKQFLGKTLDKNTGLTHVGAREYDAGIGRFISVDPLLEKDRPQTVNGYTYALNNPLAFSDASGTRSAECGTLYDCGMSTHVTSGINYYMNNDHQVAYYTRIPTCDFICAAEHVVHNNWKKPVKPTLYGLHEVLSTLGFLPGAAGPAADTTNGIVYGIQGKFGQAASSLASAIPGLGDAYAAEKKGFKLSKKLKKTCKPRHSFLTGTDVLLADGSTKDIEDVQVGDKVVVTDPATGDTTTRKVKATITTKDDKDFVNVAIASDDGPASIIATDTHPFWVESEGRWVDAGNLTPGMTLRTPDGDTVTIEHVHHYTKRQTTHDLTITDIHTYYVVAGGTAVLVHNSGKPGPGEIYLWRAVTGPELANISESRTWNSPQGIKYFSFTEHGAAEYARRAHGAYPQDGAYTMIRTTVKLADLPDSARMTYTADVVDGGVALNNEELKALGRPSIMTSTSTGVDCK